jgi:hypothetical protein
MTQPLAELPRTTRRSSLHFKKQAILTLSWRVVLRHDRLLREFCKRLD